MESWPRVVVVGPGGVGAYFGGMLARAGAFDVLDSNRRRVFESLDALVAYSAAVHEQKNSAQVSLFGEAGDDPEQ